MRKQTFRERITAKYPNDAARVEALVAENARLTRAWLDVTDKKASASMRWNFNENEYRLMSRQEDKAFQRLINFQNKVL